MTVKNLKLKRLFIYMLAAALLNLPVAAQQNQTAPKKDEQPLSVQKLNEFSRIISRRINFSDSTGNILTRMEETRSVALEYPPETKPKNMDY